MTVTKKIVVERLLNPLRRGMTRRKMEKRLLSCRQRVKARILDGEGLLVQVDRCSSRWQIWPCSQKQRQESLGLCLWSCGKQFLIDQDAVTREFWVAQAPLLRKQAAARRRHVVLQGGPGNAGQPPGQAGELLGEEEGVVPGSFSPRTNPPLVMWPRHLAMSPSTTSRRGFLPGRRPTGKPSRPSGTSPRRPGKTGPECLVLQWPM